MKILINATANDSRGPLALTKGFLLDMKNNEISFERQKISLFILVSKKELIDFETKNIKIIFNPFPKKSMFHKFYFEQVYLPWYLKNEKFDAYLSLQNTALKKGPYVQGVLIHTSLPFEDLSIKDGNFKSYLK